LHNYRLKDSFKETVSVGPEVSELNHLCQVGKIGEIITSMKDSHSNVEDKKAKMLHYPNHRITATGRLFPYRMLDMM